MTNGERQKKLFDAGMALLVHTHKLEQRWGADHWLVRLVTKLTEYLIAETGEEIKRLLELDPDEEYVSDRARWGVWLVVGFCGVIGLVEFLLLAGVL